MLIHVRFFLASGLAISLSVNKVELTISAVIKDAEIIAAHFADKISCFRRKNK